MKAEIITIGDEILIGQIVDTNSAWIAQRLNSIGFTVVRKVTVGDERTEIETALEESWSRADAVIVTGGLGPTKDDITKTTLANLFHSPLIRHEPTYRAVEAMMRARGIEFNTLNQAQALVPECCTVLPNHNGTAPGMWFERDGRVTVSLPGVPFEMESLMEQSVLPKLTERFSLRSVVHRTAITFGLAESVLAAKIADWESALPDFLHLAYLPSPSQIRLRLSAYDVDSATANSEIDRRFEQLEQIIPLHIVGYGTATVQQSLAELLVARSLTLAVAESCTGGAISSKITSMAGASRYFKGGVVSYSNEVKRTVLGVDAEVLERCGAVSEQVARQMADGVRRLCKADCAIATTGIAGPDGATADKPVGTVWIAIATAYGTFAREMHYGRLRAQNIDRASTSALFMLRLLLLGSPEVAIDEGIL